MEKSSKSSEATIWEELEEVCHLLGVVPPRRIRDLKGKVIWRMMMGLFATAINILLPRERND